MKLRNTALFNDASLVSYWEHEGDATDSKAVNNGTAANITFNAASGKFGQGGSYNGSSSNISLPNNASLKPTGNFTIGAWYKKSATAEGGIFQNYAAPVGTVSGLLFEFEGATGLRLVSGRATGGVENTDYKNCRGTIAVNDGNWHLSLGEWNGTTLSIYTDNVVDGTATWGNAAGYQATSYPRIGSRNDTGTDNVFYGGTIDEVFLMSRVLTAQEKTLLYQPESNIVGGEI